MFQDSDGIDDLGPKNGKPNSLTTWLKNWLSSDRRRAYRQPLPGLVAYYWTGSTPRAYQIADISPAGLFLLTEDRWYPGTLVLMTLQRIDSLGRNLEDAISIQAKVMRWDNEGLGLAFILPKNSDDQSRLLEGGANKKALDKFLERLDRPVSN